MSCALLAVATLVPVASLAQASVPTPAYIGAVSKPHVTIDPDLDSGFDLLYELRFEPAREKFGDWQMRHPTEPLGYALAAAADLFEQFYRQGVLTSDFFLDDKRFLDGITGKPDVELEHRFQSSAQSAEEIARSRLESHASDPDALFALTLVAGMRADNDAVIDKRQIESLHLIRDGERSAHELLVVAPDSEDAYLALGAANYILGSLPAYKRAFLWVGGIHGDKAVGMEQLSRAATSGHYLRPYAKLLLALAALREKNPGLARAELGELAAQFPQNPLFAHELAKLRPSIGGIGSASGPDSIH